MKITNNEGMPKAFERMAQGEEDYSYKEKRYSATTIIKPVREILLKRRHDEEIEQDCADMVWALFGKAVHLVLEHYGARDDNEWAEQKLEAPADNGYTVSGVIDYYDIDTGTIIDYKSCSVYKFAGGDFEDWLKQGLIYAWLLAKNGLPAKHVEFWGIMKDHSKSSARVKSGYPKLPVQKFAFDITDNDIKKTDEWVNAKMREIERCESLADEDLPLCSLDDRWHDPDKWAVMREDAATLAKKRADGVSVKAMKLCASEEEAQEYMKTKGGKSIEPRPGKDKKCADYCLCCNFCPYYNEVVAPVNASEAEAEAAKENA